MDFEKYRILEVKTGSHLYGLNTKDSDKDFFGVVILPLEYHFGLQKMEEVDLGIKDKLSNGKNSSKAVDRKFYELKRFVQLALNNNPNIIELLFVNEENIVFINDAGRRLLNLRKEFLSQKIIKNFFGFCNAQKRKMNTKAYSINQLQNAIIFLSKYNLDNSMVLPELKYEKEFEEIFIQKDKETYSIGEYNICKNLTIKEAYKSLNKILNSTTNRKELILKYGYDTKFAHHMIRVLLELKEILLTNNLIFPLQEHNLLMDIKTGKKTLEEVIDLINLLEKEINEIINTGKTQLPKEPNYKLIEKELISIYKEIFFK